MRQASAIFIGGLLLFLAIVLLVVLYQLFQVLAVIFLGVMLAQAIEPAVANMERRRVPRAAGVLAIYLVLSLFVVSLGWLIFPPIVTDLANFVVGLPNLLDTLVLFVAPWQDVLEQLDLLEDVREGLRTIGGQIASQLLALITIPLIFIQAIIAFLTVFVFAFLFSVGGGRIESFGLSLVHPDHREETMRVARKVGVRLGGYVRSELTVMTAVGLMSWAGLFVLGVPFSHLWALLAFLTEAIPMVGPVIAAVPPVIVAFFISPILALQVVVLYIVIQQIESYVLAPIIHGRQMRLSPLLVLLSILVGGSLFGLVGALVAVPAAAALHVITDEAILPWRRRQIEKDLAERRPQQEAPRAEDEDRRAEG